MSRFALIESDDAIDLVTGGSEGWSFYHFSFSGTALPLCSLQVFAFLIPEVNFKHSLYMGKILQCIMQTCRDLTNSLIHGMRRVTMPQYLKLKVFARTQP